MPLPQICAGEMLVGSTKVLITFDWIEIHKFYAAHIWNPKWFSYQGVWLSTQPKVIGVQYWVLMTRTIVVSIISAQPSPTPSATSIDRPEQPEVRSIRRRLVEDKEVNFEIGKDPKLSQKPTVDLANLTPSKMRRGGTFAWGYFVLQDP